MDKHYGSYNQNVVPSPPNSQYGNYNQFVVPSQQNSQNQFQFAQLPTSEAIQHPALPAPSFSPPFQNEATPTASIPDQQRKGHRKGGVGGDDGRYVCRFCGIAFSQSQALGGHMNRHSRERERERLLRAKILVQQHTTPTISPPFEPVYQCQPYAAPLSYQQMPSFMEPTTSRHFRLPNNINNQYNPSGAQIHPDPFQLSFSAPPSALVLSYYRQTPPNLPQEFPLAGAANELLENMNREEATRYEPDSATPVLGMSSQEGIAGTISEVIGSNKFSQPAVAFPQSVTDPSMDSILHCNEEQSFREGSGQIGEDLSKIVSTYPRNEFWRGF